MGIKKEGPAVCSLTAATGPSVVCSTSSFLVPGIVPVVLEDQGRYIRSLWEEFDRMDTADSRFAASLDRLQPFMHNVLTNGYTWELGEVTREQVYKRMSPVKEGTPALWPWVETQIDKGVENGWIK